MDQKCNYPNPKKPVHILKTIFLIFIIIIFFENNQFLRYVMF